MNTRNKQRAFTLLEIMIVVAIIGLLATIALPSFLKARESSQLNVCLGNLRVYQGALEEYAFIDGQYPSDAKELVTQGYLKKVFTCSVGGAYDWSVSGDQYHITCDGQHTVSIQHVCIHEDQGPEAK